MNNALQRFGCNKKSLFSVIRTIICVCKIYGLAPYSLPATNRTQKCNYYLNLITNTLIALGKFDCVCEFFHPTKKLIVGISTATIYSYAATYNKKVANKPKLYVIYELIQGMKVVSCAVITLHVLLRREKFVKACRKLHNVDLLIKNLEKSTPCYNHYFLLSLACVSIPIFHVIYIAYFYHTQSQDFYATMLHFFTERLQQEINLLVTFYYSFYVTILYRRLAFINKVLLDLNNNKCKQNSLLVLRTVIKMHEKLCKGAKYFNRMFSLPLFLLIICQGPELLLLLYMIYRGVELNVTGKFVGFLLQQLNILCPIRLAYAEVRKFVVLNQHTVVLCLQEQLIPINLAEIELCYKNVQMSSAVSKPQV